jgi:hypothetical protein
LTEFLGSLVWLALALLALLPLQDWIAGTFTSLFLRLTGNPQTALRLYFALFFPGILLHEGSHWMAGFLLGARPKRFSLRPVRLPDGRYRMGYVETRRTDPFRGALIGAAPLAAGAAALLLIGFSLLHLDDLAWAAQRQAWATAQDWLRATLQSSAAPLWIYLAVAVGQTMLPSREDRQSWLPLAVLAAAAISLAIGAGLGPRLAIWLLPPAAAALRTLASVFTLTIALDLALAPFLLVLSRLGGGLHAPRTRR